MPEDTMIEEPVQGEVPAQENEIEDSAPEVDENQEMWSKAVPDLADEYESLDPDTRQRILLKRLAAQSAGEATGVDTSKDTSTDDDTQKPSRPPVPKIPQVDLTKLHDAFAKSFDEGDPAPAVAEIAKAMEYVNGVAQLAFQAQQEVGESLAAMGGRLDEFSLPTQFQMAMPQVPGAKDGDMASAKELLRSGEAKNPVTALKLAVFNRQMELGSAKGKPSPSDAAKRKARSIRASRESGGGVSDGVPVKRIPETDAEMKALMEDEEKLKQQ